MSMIAITTVDNPFNPITQFNDWLSFDLEHNYNSCDRLARIARTSNQLSDEENEIEIERAIDEIVNQDPLKIYKKFTLAEDKNETDAV